MFEMPSRRRARLEAMNRLPRPMVDAMFKAIAAGVPKRDILRGVQNEVVRRGRGRGDEFCRLVAQFLGISLEGK